MANGLPLDPDLIREPPGTLPISPGISTGRAADLLPLMQGSGKSPEGLTLPSGNLLKLGNVPANVERQAEQAAADAEADEARWDPLKTVGLTLLGAQFRDPGLGARWLADKQADRRRQGMELYKLQIELGKAASTHQLQTAQSVKLWSDTLRDFAPELATATPERRAAYAKALKQDAQKSPIPLLLSEMADVIVEQPDLARLFPDFVPFLDGRLVATMGLRLRTAMREGKGEDVMWEWSVPNVYRALADRMTAILPSLKEAAGDQPLRFETAAKALTGGNLVLERFLHGALPEGQAKVTEGARQGLLNRLTQFGVTSPSTAAKAQEAGATERATLEAREPFKTPDLSPATLNELALTGLAARTATPEQRQQAQARAEQRENAQAVAKTEAVERAKQRVEAMAPDKPATPDEVDRLRDDFTKAAGTFVTVRDAFTRVKASAKEPSAAGDLAMIYAFMKMLDPGSVIRESEFAQAAQAGSYGDRIAALVNRAIKGERLSAGVRQDFLDRGTRLFREQLTTHEETETAFRGLAQKRKIDEGRVVTDLPGRLRGEGRATPAAKTETPDARAREKFLKKR